jgi:hypothetical protein
MSYETPWRSLGDSNPCFRRERPISSFEKTLNDDDRRTVPERDSMLALMAAGLRLAPQNEARTPCYHFATQFGSTDCYRPEQGSTLKQNSLDDSVLAGTEHHPERRQRPN